MKLTPALFLFAMLPTAAFAAPMLRAEVEVTAPVVTVGDMFDDAGDLAGTALFRAPAPGTSGLVSLGDVRAAANRAGLVGYTLDGVTRVRVTRDATVVDNTMLAGLVAADLKARALVPADAQVAASFDRTLTWNAEAVVDPVRLVTLRYAPGGANFAARFEIAGIDQPVEVTGSVALTVEMPHLATTLPAGSLLTPNDIVMQPVPLAYASQNGVDDASLLIGKSLVRNGRAGLMLRVSDVTEPLVVKRNDLVSVVLRAGPMTLTVKGQSLGDASAGQPVAVLNVVTKKILNGTASSAGVVEISTDPARVAGL